MDTTNILSAIRCRVDGGFNLYLAKVTLGHVFIVKAISAQVALASEQKRIICIGGRTELVAMLPGLAPLYQSSGLGVGYYDVKRKKWCDSPLTEASRWCRIPIIKKVVVG